MPHFPYRVMLTIPSGSLAFRSVSQAIEFCRRIEVPAVVFDDRIGAIIYRNYEGGA